MRGWGWGGGGDERERRKHLRAGRSQPSFSWPFSRKRGVLRMGGENLASQRLRTMILTREVLGHSTKWSRVPCAQLAPQTPQVRGQRLFPTHPTPRVHASHSYHTL